MIADVEKPDGTYAQVEMGEPECGVDFCDGCGDCLDCQHHDDKDWCPAGSSRWVVYLTDPKNPYRVVSATDGVAGLPEVDALVLPKEKQ